jgi:hypothetical protein
VAKAEINGTTRILINSLPHFTTTSDLTKEIPLPELLSYRLTIKNGALYTACRDKVAPSDFIFHVSTGYRVLRATIEEKFELLCPVNGTRTWMSF